MELDTDPLPYTRCYGCLTTGRTLSLLSDKKGIEMFSILLDNLDVENHNIPLCYECMGRLYSFLRFRQQVKKAYRYLKRFPESKAKSLSRLSLIRTEKYEWKPQVPIRRPMLLPPNIIHQTEIGYTPKTNSQKRLNTNTECIIVDLDIDEEKRSDVMYDTMNSEKDQPKFDTLALDKDELKTKINKQNKETNLANFDTSNVDNIEKSQTKFKTLAIEKDRPKLNTENSEKYQPEFDVQDEERNYSDLDTPFLEKTESDFDLPDKITQKIKLEIDEIQDLDIKPDIGDQKETELELKQIDCLIVPVSKYEFSDSDDEPLNVKKVKKEGVLKKGPKRRGRRPGVVSSASVRKQFEDLNIAPGHIERIILSWEEVEEERRIALTSEKYTRNKFRCATCVVSFNHSMKLETHNKRHLPEAGALECHICKTRSRSESAMMCHMRRHTARWRCCHCGTVYSRVTVAADHVTREHNAPPARHACRVCSHVATSLGKLRIHMKSHAECQHCEQCGKTFKDRYALRNHLFIHTNRKDFNCEVCDKSFRSKHSLESHSLTHQKSLLLYCKDCDMNFKNHKSYYQHLRYSVKHVKPEDLKFACEFCPSRFTRPRRLEEHRFSIHLKLAPHKCEEKGCDFASASRSSLRTHMRLVHRNQRFLRNYVCHTCGKAYLSKKTLEGHIRSHTGERPYKCAVCPSTHAHASSLYHHMKFKHKALFERQRKERQKKKGLDWHSDSDVTETSGNDETVADT